MPVRPARTTAAGRRRERLGKSQWVGTGAAASAAVAIALLSPLASDAVLAYFLAVIVAVVASRGRLALAVGTVPVALAAYRSTLDLAWRESPSEIFTAASLTLFAGAAIGAWAAGVLREEERYIRESGRLTNTMGYEVFALLLDKDAARCQRYKSTGTLAICRLRNLDALTRPDAYQQHEILTTRVLETVSKGLRRSDTACYLGDLHFAITFPNTSGEQAWIAIERLKRALAPISQRLCPTVHSGPLDWETVCLEYPTDGATAVELLETGARTLGEHAQRRVADLERQRACRSGSGSTPVDGYVSGNGRSHSASPQKLRR